MHRDFTFQPNPVGHHVEGFSGSHLLHRKGLFSIKCSFETLGSKPLEGRFPSSGVDAPMGKVTAL